MLWIKLKDNVAQIKMVEMPDKSFAIGIFGLDNKSYPWYVATAKFGFLVSNSGLSLLRQGSIKKAEAIAIFGKNRVSIEDMHKDKVYVLRKPSLNSPAKTQEEKVDTQVSLYLGMNYLGQRIMVTTTGSRYIHMTEQSEGVIAEDSVLVPPVFLRVKNDADLDLCADGFVLQAETEYMRPMDVRRFCSTIYGEKEIVSENDSRLRKIQEAIESASFRRISKEFNQKENLEQVFGFAESLYERLPTAVFRTSASISLQQYSTPITMSVAAQNALGDVYGMKLLEPTIGNASLISVVSGANVTGIELDHNRFVATENSFKSGINSNQIKLIHGDFLQLANGEAEKQYDAIISNPPFGGLDKAVQYHGLKVTRLDHLILLKSLELRKDDGRSVFIIGSDRNTVFEKDAGLISGGSTYLFNWLNDHYETDVIEINGSMYAKQGAGFPVRMVAVGRRRTEDEVKEAITSEKYRFPKNHRLDVAKTTGDIWEFSVRLRSFLDASCGVPADYVKDEKPVDMEFGGDNDYQTQYVPMSNGNTSAMIPRNMLSAQQMAFNSFISENGDPNEFVMKELEIDSLDNFEPEQIDAIAMGIWNIKRGRALILADQTGMGKGRIVAGLARWAALHNKQTNFLTEKASLFSDFYRDLDDVDSTDLFTPFIMNEDTSIVSMSGEDQDILVAKTPKAIRETVINSDQPAIDHGFNLMLSTYSQFNRDPAKSAKARYIFNENAINGSLIILDESHNASGDSNTSRNVTQAVINSDAALYSSATYAKSSKNMGVYYKAFPESVNINTLQDTLDAGGEALQEIMSSMLCQDGVLVRREHDLSKLKFKTLDVPEDKMARNIRISDQVSDILSLMANISSDVESMVNRETKEIKKMLETLNEEQKKGARLGVSYQNFGSRLYNIMRQLSLVLVADQVVDSAVSALRNGQKPVIVLENTFESVISELASDLSIENVDGSTSTSAMSIKDILYRLSDKMTEVNITSGYGNIEKESVITLAKNDMELNAALKVFARLREKISQMDDMVAMPIDSIIHGITLAGFTVGEVSGRKFSNKFLADGNVSRESRIADKNQTIFEFNSGVKDAVILTRSGCTGISLHASEKFLDQRQRVMIEAQIAQNVAERVQFFGRVNRRGQVSFPEIWSVTSGLPWEIRTLAMQNMKLRKLSANVQSNRRNSAEMKDIPDLLNSIGDDVCREHLMNNPDVASTVGLNMDKESSESSEEGENGCFFANRLTGRICLLPVSKQESIYESLNNEFDARVLDLTAKGINPFEQRILDIKARVVDKREVVQGVESGSVFDAPVFAEKLEWDREIAPRTFNDMVDMANESSSFLPGHVTVTKFENGLPKTNYGSVDTSRMPKAINYDQKLSLIKIEKMGKKIPSFVDFTDLKLFIEQDYKKSCYNAVDLGLKRKDLDDFEHKDMTRDEIVIKKIDDMVNSEQTSAIKFIVTRAKWLIDNIDKFAPGTFVTFSNDEGVAMDGMVVSLKITESRSAHLLGNYHLGIVTPNEDKVFRITANSLVSDSNFDLCREPERIINEFDSAPSGKITFSRWVLSGNLFRAAEIAATSSLGQSGIYTTEDGSRKRAIIMNSMVDYLAIKNAQVQVTEQDAINIVIEKTTKLMLGDHSVRFSFGNAELRCGFKNETKSMIINLPGTKIAAGDIFTNKDVLAITGEFTGTRTKMSAIFSVEENLEDKIRTLVGVFYSSKRFLVQSLDNMSKQDDDMNNDDKNALSLRQASN